MGDSPKEQESDRGRRGDSGDELGSSESEPSSLRRPGRVGDRLLGASLLAEHCCWGRGEEGGEEGGEESGVEEGLREDLVEGEGRKEGRRGSEVWWCSSSLKMAVGWEPTGPDGVERIYYQRGTREDTDRTRGDAQDETDDDIKNKHTPHTNGGRRSSNVGGARGERAKNDREIDGRPLPSDAARSPN